MMGGLVGVSIPANGRRVRGDIEGRQSRARAGLGVIAGLWAIRCRPSGKITLAGLGETAGRVVCMYICSREVSRSQVLMVHGWQG
jgi:hypothetical protein